MEMFIPRVHLPWESHLKTLTLLRNFMDFSKYMGAGSQGGLILKNYPANRRTANVLQIFQGMLLLSYVVGTGMTQIQTLHLHLGQETDATMCNCSHCDSCGCCFFLAEPGARDSKMSWHAFGHSFGEGRIHRSALASGCGQVRLFRSFGQQFPAVTDVAVKLCNGDSAVLK